MLWLEPALAGIAILVADQAGKHFVLTRPRYAIARAPRSFFALRCVVNRRYGRFPAHIRLLIAFCFVMGVVLALFALAQEPLRSNVPGAVGIGGALGGIASTFIDLLRRGGIVDFIAIGPLPVCNIADLAIYGGFALAALSIALWIGV